MQFRTIGEKENPVVVMLTGSFCPGECLEYLSFRMKEFFIVIPTYNGHYQGSKDFTTRENEAAEIKDYLCDLGIDEIHLIYGQSMGSEVGMELYRQLSKEKIKVNHLVWDGAPMIKFSRPYRAFMRFKFGMMIKMFHDKSLDEAMNMKFLKQFAGNKINSLKPMIESLVSIAPFITKKTLRNEVECCYTFDFPALDVAMQKRTWFFYGEDEKAINCAIGSSKKPTPMQTIELKKVMGISPTPAIIRMRILPG